ncbi:3'-5' exoribonuclease 1-like [Saccoglossus kowalevskii]|uniref:3'-5' exoribonuclease 1-like n=1 Tax=Saccoglossus kowalevskii TaxID=10224 RepID=A0ABM0GRB5_SACKO|nr:PREDICTED: 3'-5' exoribonuclease 1-like [Saccoglossus kowalevskii]
MPRPEFYLCFDLEATCVDPKCPANQVTEGFQPEIIDIGAVILDSNTLEEKGEFQSYCRPVKHPTLQPFCLELTKISQETVDAADEFPDVWGRFIDWMKSKGLKPGAETPNFQLVTDGPFDCGKYLFIQFNNTSKLSFPHWARNFVELKTEYKSYKRLVGRRWPKLSDMLAGLGLLRSGSNHRALADAHSVADVTKTVLRRRGDKYIPKTERMKPFSY